MARSDHQMTTTCLNCGYNAPHGTGQWDQAIHPTLGTLTKCPDCGSTNVQSR